MSILYPGGAGYIKSDTCLELLKSDYEIIVTDNLHNIKYEALKRVREISRKFGHIKAVIHPVDHTAVGETVGLPLCNLHNNFIRADLYASNVIGEQ